MNNALIGLHVQFIMLPNWIKQLGTLLILLFIVDAVFAAETNPFAPPETWKTNADAGGKAWWDYIGKLATRISLGAAIILLLASKTQYLWIPLIVIAVASLGDNFAEWALKAGA